MKMNKNLLIKLSNLSLRYLNFSQSTISARTMNVDVSERRHTSSTHTEGAQDRHTISTCHLYHQSTYNFCNLFW